MQFEGVFTMARQLGFRTSAHAGEAAGAESIWGAIRSLNVDRIGHGTRAKEDNILLDYLVKQKIPVEMCPTSNVRTGVVESYEKHPIRHYYERGMLLSINTDDPKMLGNSLAEEYMLLEEKKEFTRAVIKLDSRKKLIFHDTRKFGRIYLYNDLTPINERHGPEPLGKYFSVGWLHRALQQRKRNIKALLLDQSFLAGLGNIYVDESLWEAGIHPGSISNALPAARISRLHEAVQAILKAAITAKGTTIIDFSYLNGQNGRYTSQLRIFGRKGQPCITCGRDIEKIKVAGRGTYVCSRCQKKYTRGQSAPHQDRG